MGGSLLAAPVACRNARCTSSPRPRTAATCWRGRGSGAATPKRVGRRPTGRRGLASVATRRTASPARRSMKERGHCPPVAALHLRLEPGGYRGVEAGREEDDRRPHGRPRQAGRPPQASAPAVSRAGSARRAARPHGQLTLDVRGDTKATASTAPISPSTSEGLRSVLRGGRRAPRPIPAPYTDQLCSGMSCDSRGMHGRGPETGADQANAQTRGSLRPNPHAAARAAASRRRMRSDPQPPLALPGMWSRLSAPAGQCRRSLSGGNRTSGYTSASWPLQVRAGVCRPRVRSDTVRRLARIPDLGAAGRR